MEILNCRVAKLQFEIELRDKQQALKGKQEKCEKCAQEKSENSEIQFLREENTKKDKDLNDLDWQLFQTEMREKKIMFLVQLLQNRGYPVTQVFEKEVKPIDTMRFDEFLADRDR